MLVIDNIFILQTQLFLLTVIVKGGGKSWKFEKHLSLGIVLLFVVYVPD